VSACRDDRTARGAPEADPDITGKYKAPTMGEDEWFHFSAFRQANFDCFTYQTTASFTDPALNPLEV
jgi:hypothetical protein